MSKTWILLSAPLKLFT